MWGRAIVGGFLGLTLGLAGLGPAGVALGGPCPPPQKVCTPEEEEPPSPGQDGIASLDVYIGDTSAEAIEALIGDGLVAPLAALAPERSVARLLTTVPVVAAAGPLYRWVVALALGLIGVALTAAILGGVSGRALGLAADGWPALLARAGLAAAGMAVTPAGLPRLADLGGALARLGGDHIAAFYFAGAPGDGLGGAVVTLTLAVLFALLLLQAVGRCALVNLLALLAPLAFAGLVAPQTRDWPARWARLLLATLLAPALQMMVIALALALRTSLPEPARSLLTIAAAYAALRAPGLLLGDGGGAGGLILAAVGAVPLLRGPRSVGPGQPARPPPWSSSTAPGSPRQATNLPEPAPPRATHPSIPAPQSRRPSP